MALNRAESEEKSENEDKLFLSEDHFSVHEDCDDLNDEELTVSSESQLEIAIAKHIKVLRSVTDDDMKRTLVKKICELRIKLNKLNEICEELYVLGHRLLKLNDSKSNANYVCDRCLKKQKSVLKIFASKTVENYLLMCEFCGLCVHQRCQLNLTRKCPKLMFEEIAHNYTLKVILKICPEIGLASQNFRCEECKIVINLENSRICDYSGRYYCASCHFGETDLMVIPARVIHNWDFNPRPVSRCSLQIINYINLKPILFNITELNSMLYGLVDELAHVKRVRSELTQMIKYIRLCKQPDKPRLSLHKYLVDEEAINSYSLADLGNLQQLFKSLSETHNIFMKHIIKDCERCRGKGFFCELCRDKNDLLFPFSPNIANCINCSAVYHKNCYYRKNKYCPRCHRIKVKQEENDITLITTES